MSFLESKVAKPQVAPTLMLLEWRPGSVIGGFAAVPWPAQDVQPEFASDWDCGSFIFELVPGVRYELNDRVHALARSRDRESGWRAFCFGLDLSVYDDGMCGTAGAWNYTGPRDGGQFPEADQAEKFVRFELWSL